MGERALAKLSSHRASGSVFQFIHLMDELTAIENVELPGLMAGRSPRSSQDAAMALLEQVGLAERADSPDLGTLRRPASTRRHRTRPQQSTAVVFADEPHGNLDSPPRPRCSGSSTAFDELGRRWVIVTHDHASPPQPTGYFHARRFLRGPDRHRTGMPSTRPAAIATLAGLPGLEG